MIIVKLQGGLGNQLFQYAYGRSLAHSKDQQLLLDTSWHKGRLSRPYLLDHFAIEAKKASFLTLLFHKKEVIEDISGAWHSENYFKDISDIIRKEFTLRQPLSPEHMLFMEKIRSTNAVSLHLRGTDYVRGAKSSFHGTASPEYYTTAIKLIKEKTLDPHFFIFTDDLPWAKKHIRFPEPYTIIQTSLNLPHQELILMSECSHNIIANSTYSWWGAWLNRHPQKIVIAPSQWFADTTAPTSDIIPSSWITI